MTHSRAPHPSAAELRSIAVTAAHTAGAPLKTAFRSQMDVELKTSAHDLVTVWDTQTETTLIDLLSNAVPDSRFTGRRADLMVKAVWSGSLTRSTAPPISPTGSPCSASRWPRP